MIKTSFLGLITNPKEHFETMKSNPAIAWIPLTLLFLIIMLVRAYLEEPYFIFEFAGNTGMQVVIGLLTVAVFAIVFLFLVFGTMITSWITQGVVKLFGGNLLFKHSFSLNMHLWLITLYGLAFNMILSMLIHTSPDEYFTSVADYLSVTGFWYGFLSYVDLFDIWYTILLAMGLNTLTNLSTKKSWSIAILIWAIGAVLVGLASTL